MCSTQNEVLQTPFSLSILSFLQWMGGGGRGWEGRTLSSTCNPRWTCMSATILYHRRTVPNLHTTDKLHPSLHNQPPQSFGSFMPLYNRMIPQVPLFSQTWHLEWRSRSFKLVSNCTAKKYLSSSQSCKQSVNNHSQASLRNLFYKTIMLTFLPWIPNGQNIFSMNINKPTGHDSKLHSST